MGKVYLAQHAQSGLQVALKNMLPEVAAEPNSVRHFLRETAMTAEVIDTALIDNPAITFETAADFKRALQGTM